MKTVDVDEVSRALLTLIDAVFARQVSSAQLRDHVRELLYGQRALLHHVSTGVITQEEAVFALVDRVHTWFEIELDRRLPQYPPEQWKAVTAPVYSALFER